MNKFFIHTLFIFIFLFINACATTGPSKLPQVPPVYGTAIRAFSNDQNLAAEAIKVSEIYWNAQKNSDGRLFRSVTPHESMHVVFDWTYNNKSDVVVESAQIMGIQNHLLKFKDHHEQYAALPKYSQGSIRELEAASQYADRIEKGGYPMLGNLMKKAYWDAIIPINFSDLSDYKLMNIKYIADVKAQSRGGLVLQKRVTLDLYRMQADGFDSGWKVLFVFGL